MPPIYLITTPVTTTLVEVRPTHCAEVRVPYLASVRIRTTWTAVRAWLKAQWGERVLVGRVG